MASLNIDRAGGRIQLDSGPYAGFLLEIPPDAVPAPATISVTAAKIWRGCPRILRPGRPGSHPGAARDSLRQARDPDAAARLRPRWRG